MNEKGPYLLEFGSFRLDVCKKTLTHEGTPVAMPLKEIELLCVLIENRGELVTKDELLDKVWEDSFVEESNLSRHIYLLRKTFKDLGESDGFIQTVPRRGYRFAGEVRELTNGEVIVEKHTSTRTLIEFQDDAGDSIRALSAERKSAAARLAPLALLVVSVTAGLFFVWKYALPTETAESTPISSIAVLPVKSFSENAGDEELRMRLTDALITRLGSGGLAVRPTSAVMPFNDSDLGHLEIGRMLQVDAVIDSRVQEEDGRIRVTVQLVRVADGEQIWSEQFDGLANRTLDLQDAISSKVSSSLTGTEFGPAQASKRPTNNPEAFEAYLKGRYFWIKRDGPSLLRSIEYFSQAAELDPEFSEAYSGLADSQHLLFNYNIDVDRQLVEKAKANVDRALKLKPNSADALLTLGSIRMGYDWDWAGAEEALKLAVASEPNSAMAHIRYGVLLIRIRRFDEAQAEFQRSLELDPLSLIGKMNLGMTYFCRKDYAAAEQVFRNVLEVDDKVAGSHWLLSRTLWLMGRKDEAMEQIAIGLAKDGNKPLADKIRGASAESNYDDAVKLLLHEWRSIPPETNKINMAYLSTYVNDTDGAIYWLERSFEERHPWTTWVSAYPEFEALYNDHRYQKLLGQMNMKY